MVATVAPAHGSEDVVPENETSIRHGLDHVGTKKKKRLERRFKSEIGLQKKSAD